ncbi:MAG: DUF2490 domain-containing protein [Chitinophagales bacterium]|nr:DUF2490 domain-containing protein [Chitinophagales bacterium]
MTIKKIQPIIKSIFIIIFLCHTFSSNAIENRNLAWLSYSNTIKFNQKWSINNEITERLFMSPIAQNQVVYKIKISRTLGEKKLWDISPGIGFSFQSTPQTPYRENTLIIPEIRPQIELNGRQKLSKITFQHRFRLESRFYHHTTVDKKELANGYYYKNLRFRYQFAINIPLFTWKENQKVQLKVADEVHLKFLGKSIDNIFDHNRFSTSITIDVSPSTNIETGYQLWIKENLLSHFFRLGVSQTFKIHSKK